MIKEDWSSVLHGRWAAATLLLRPTFKEEDDAMDRMSSEMRVISEDYNDFMIGVG